MTKERTCNVNINIPVPVGYECTGEYRAPILNEYYIPEGGCLHSPMQACGSSIKGRRFILRKAKSAQEQMQEQLKDVYGIIVPESIYIYRITPDYDGDITLEFRKQV